MSRPPVLLLLAAACGEGTPPASPARTAHLVVSPWTTVAPGDTTRLHAVVLDSNGSHRSVAVTWASADRAVGAVDEAGLVTGGESGVVTITATAGLLTSHAVVAVQPAVLLGAGDIASCTSLGDEATAALRRPSMTPAPTSSSPVTSTTTNASRPRARPASTTRSAASGSSSWGRAAPATSPSGRRSRTASGATTPPSACSG